MTFTHSRSKLTFVNRLFPEFAQYEAFVLAVSELPASEQSQFWIDAMCDLKLRRRSDAADRLSELGKDWEDIDHELVKLGASAVPALLGLMDSVVLAPQFNSQGSPEYEADGAFTSASQLYSSSLWLLERIEARSPELKARLLRYLTDLFRAAGAGDSLIGTNCMATAQALHALWPQQFPTVEFGDTTNRLLNPDGFGLS